MHKNKLFGKTFRKNMSFAEQFIVLQNLFFLFFCGKFCRTINCSAKLSGKEKFCRKIHFPAKLSKKHNCCIKKKYTIPSKYHGTKLEEIRYILVEFFEDFVVISEEKSVLKIIKYTKINLLFSKWTNRRDGLSIKTSKIPPDLSKLKIIKKEIATFFLTERNCIVFVSLSHLDRV